MWTKLTSRDITRGAAIDSHMNSMRTTSEPMTLTDNNPKVSILILNYNGKQHLTECLNSLKSQSYPDYDVYLIDNGSTDGSVEFVKKYFSWVKIISYDQNLGFAKAYNRAAKIVNAKFVAFLNNDTKAEKNWLSNLMRVVEEDKSIIAVGSKILLYHAPHLLNCAGAKLTPIGGGFDIGLYEHDIGKYNIKRLVGAVCGAAMLVRRDKFLEVGGFDEDFFAYFEDSDFCWRSWIYGYKTIYVPSSIVYHKLGGSWGIRGTPIKIFYGQRNKWMSAIKNFEADNLVVAMVISVMFDVLQSVSLLFRRNIKGLSALLKANFWVFTNLENIMKKRRVIQSIRKFPDKYLKKKDLLATSRECFKEFMKLESRSLRERKIRDNKN